LDHGDGLLSTLVVNGGMSLCFRMKFEIRSLPARQEIDPACPAIGVHRAVVHSA
jgi:hypothetical protein